MTAPVLLTVTREARGTRYRLVLWTVDGSPGVAWPDARWSVGDLSRHAAPHAGWLESTGLLEADAVTVAEILAENWPRLVG
jgi:hypothetical protein